MFLPLRYAGYAIYDVRRLIVPRTKLEERLFLEATRRIPCAFRMGSPWGEELREGTLWIDEKQHDRTIKDIRLGLRANTNYIRDIFHAIKEDVTRLAIEVQGKQDTDMEQGDPMELLEACASALSWFATNWLNPFPAVRMAIARLLGDAEVEQYMHILLTSEMPPVYLQANMALAKVRDKSINDKTFRQEWGPLYTIGDEENVVLADPEAVSMLAAKNDLSYVDQAALLKTSRDHNSKRQTLVNRLLTQAQCVDGKEAMTLLQAQIDLLACIVWEEENRRLFQQQTYFLCRAWSQVAGPAVHFQLVTRIPWVDHAFELCK